MKKRFKILIRDEETTLDRFWCNTMQDCLKCVRNYIINELDDCSGIEIYCKDYENDEYYIYNYGKFEKLVD